MRTYTNKCFTKEYYKWYMNGGKHIPENIILTPLCCMVWYLGDGCICHSNRSEYIKLSTHCFSKEEQEKLLIPQLKKFEAKLMKNKENQFFVYIPHRKEKDFLQYIGECPFTDYSYKWNVAEYKNKIAQNHKRNEKTFCKMFLEGKSYYSIAKHFNIEPSVVRYYLLKNNIYNPLVKDT